MVINHPNKSQEIFFYWGGTGFAYVLKGRGSGLCVWKCARQGGGGKKGRFFAYVLIECPPNQYQYYRVKNWNIYMCEIEPFLERVTLKRYAYTTEIFYENDNKKLKTLCSLV